MTSPDPASTGTPTLPRSLADGKLLVDEPCPSVTRLTISNPAKRNALDHPILDAITDTLGALSSPLPQEHPTREGDDGSAEALGAPARCVVVTGADGMFSAGYDIGEIPDEDFEATAERLVAHPFTQAIEALERFPHPTLASLPGHTIGGGLELALACDLRVAREGIRLGMPPAKLGLVYSHIGIKRFIDTVGAARTRELFLLARNIDAATALTWGLVNFVATAENLEDRTLELAGELAGHAPLSQTGNKRVIGALLAARDQLDEATERELIALRRASFSTDDMREGMRAFAQKRAPRWRGR
ncbi:MAG: enoyl-CoA hydratase/isomerase family protein [Solirubrobacteraceae bacterium]